MDKKIIMITGVTSGIGLESARVLLEKGYDVIGVSRNYKKEAEARKYLGKDFVFIHGELSSKKSQEEIASKAKAYLNGRGLDVLVNNAGTFFSKREESLDGIEMQLAVNAFAPLYLSLLLYKELSMKNGRVINVTSSSHYNTIIKWRDLQLTNNYNQLKAYKQSKTLSILLSREFNEMSKNIKTYMADPGLVSTDMGFKNTTTISQLVWKIRKLQGRPVGEGAKTTIYLATKADKSNAMYYKYCKSKKSSIKSRNRENQKRIWAYFIDVFGVDPTDFLG